MIVKTNIFSYDLGVFVFVIVSANFRKREFLHQSLLSLEMMIKENKG